ncbi:MAG TPA: gamma-glutamyltransferase [bacterium]|jgi:gamma-glutamyltranspeptidase/glutathione hydrolase
MKPRCLFAVSAVCPILLIALLATGCAPGPMAKKPVAAVAPKHSAPSAAPAPVDTNFAHSVPLSANKGMVVCAHPLAAKVGRDVLASGGNAMDAAVATVAALNVVEPHASGLGGGGFLLYYDAKHDSFAVIDYRERVPHSIDIAKYNDPKDTLRLVQRSGATSVLVPGAPAGWQMMHNSFGTRPLKELLAPAIALADTGYAVSEKQSAMILDHLADIQADTAGLAKVFLSDNLPLQPGQKLRQPRLAETLRFLSKTRLDNFYFPPIGDKVAATVKAHGGFIDSEDLMYYRARERWPLRGMYHGYEIITLPPPSSGGTMLLEILKLVEPLDLKSMGHLSADYIQTLATASRQALKDGDSWIGDPDYNMTPTKELLSDSWTAEARHRMKSDSVPDKITAMDSVRAFSMGNTTHLVVVDSSGDMVSLTQSINYFYGAGLMVPELGLLLNNHMGDFGTEPSGPKAIAPFHRPPSNMAATIVRKDGKPILVIGSPGGPRIAPTLAQVLIDLLDFGMPLNEALDAPRFFPAGKTLVVENRIPQTTLKTLAAKGWKVYPNGTANSYFGGVHAIRIDTTSGMLTGAADPRRDGAPAGY